MIWVSKLAQMKRINQIVNSELQVPKVVLKRNSCYDEDEDIDHQVAKRSSEDMCMI